MDVFAISDLTGLNEEQKVIVQDHWRRRVVSTSVVLIPGGIDMATLSWMADMPGRIIVSPRQNESFQELVDAAEDMDDIYILGDEAIYFPGMRRTTNQVEKGLTIVGCHGPADWPRSKGAADELRQDAKDVLIVLASACPLFVGGNTELAQQWNDDDVNACVYGGVSQARWNQCWQGKYGKTNAWDNADYRFVDAFFLDGIITYIGDVDHAGWLRKDRERISSTTVKTIPSENAAARDCPPLSITRAPTREPVLYTLPAPVVKKAPTTTATTTTKTTTSSSTRPPGIKDLSSQDGTEEYQKWLSYLTRSEDDGLTVAEFCQKWPGIAGWYGRYFDQYAADTKLQAVYERELAEPSWPPPVTGDGWRTYLERMPQSMQLRAVRNLYVEDWSRWEELWTSYEDVLSIKQVRDVERESPTELGHVSTNIDTTNEATQDTIDVVADGHPFTERQLIQLRKLCIAYEDNLIQTVAHNRGDSPEAALLIQAREYFSVVSMEQLLPVVNDEHTRLEKALGVVEDTAADTAANENATSFAEALNQLDNHLTVMDIMNKHAAWWKNWSSHCSAFRSVATVADIQLVVTDDTAKAGWEDVLWLFDGSSTLSKIRTDVPSLDEDFPASRAYRDNLTIDEILEDTLVRDGRIRVSQPQTTTPVATDTFDWDQIVTAICAVDANSSLAKFEAELAHTVMRVT